MEAQRRMHARYRPYPQRDGATPAELRFTARTLGPSSHIGMTIQDVVQVCHAIIGLVVELTQTHSCSLLQGKELFIQALSMLPDRVLLKAYQAKQADRDCIARGVALTLAEIESAERHKDYLSAIYGQREGELAVTKEQLDVLEELLDKRGLSDVEDDSGFHRAVYADELVALTIVEGQTNQMKEVVESRVSWRDPDLGDEESSSDEDRKLPFMGLLSSDDDPGF